MKVQESMVKNLGNESELPPCILSRKILCPAFMPAPFRNKDRLLFLGLHAMTTLKVIARQLKLHHRLRSVEKHGNGFRIDLIFEIPSGGLRIHEVKSAKNLREVHKIQTALYWNEEFDEIILSNGQEDMVISKEYIQSVRRKAKLTCKLLENDPELAKVSFKPNSDVCYICANSKCLFLPKKGDEGT